jgi:hypothetical protein
MNNKLTTRDNRNWKASCHWIVVHFTEVINGMCACKTAPLLQQMREQIEKQIHTPFVDFLSLLCLGCITSQNVACLRWVVGRIRSSENLGGYWKEETKIHIACGWKGKIKATGYVYMYISVTVLSNEQNSTEPNVYTKSVLTSVNNNLIFNRRL